jgi:DNA-binding NtrC family response regulator
VAHFCRGQKRALRFSEAALAMLANAAWPGHVRQLRNLVDRVAAFADDDLVTPEALAPFMSESPASNTNADVLQSAAQRILRLPIENKLEAIEEALVAEAVRLSDGNKSGAARLLGMHRKAVSRRL